MSLGRVLVVDDVVGSEDAFVEVAEVGVQKRVPFLLPRGSSAQRVSGPRAQ